MSSLVSLLPLLLISSLCLWGLINGVDVYAALCQGAKKGLEVLGGLLPALICLFPMISLFRASGLPELLGEWLAPFFARLGLPTETMLIMLLRPLSGSGALSAAGELISQYGADSLIGRTAAVMLGSSETTFYVIAVYFSSAGIKNSRWAVPAALTADLCCFISSAWVCRLLWG